MLLFSVSKHTLSHYHPIQASCINLRAVYLVKHRLNLLWTPSWRCIPWAVFSSLLKERGIAQGSVGNRIVSLKKLLTNPLSFSKSVLKLLILNTMVQQSSEDLSSSASHVAGLGQNSWGWGKTALQKDKVSLGIWRAEETEPRGNIPLTLQKKSTDCDLLRFCKATLLSLLVLAG